MMHLKQVLAAILFGSLLLSGGLDKAEAQTAGSSGMHVAFIYPKNDDVKTVLLKLSYRYWDVNVDGDVPSEKVLLTGKMDFPSGDVPISVSLDDKKSILVIGGKTFTGKGFHLDSSFARAKKPPLDYNDFYVLAQKPVDPKNPAAMGDTQSAAAWIELGISPQP